MKLQGNSENSERSAFFVDQSKRREDNSVLVHYYIYIVDNLFIMKIMNKELEIQ